MVDRISQNWVAFWILSLATQTGLGKLISLSEPRCLASETGAEDASLVNVRKPEPGTQ